jgi:hypothetical protein
MGGGTGRLGRLPPAVLLPGGGGGGGGAPGRTCPGGTGVMAGTGVGIGAATGGTPNGGEAAPYAGAPAEAP